MMGKLHMTTLSSPELSAGSSVWTSGSGSGRELARPAGCAGSERSTTWSPSECQVTNARCLVSVGLCDEKLAKLSRMGETDEHVLGSLTGSLYSEVSLGAAGSAMLMKRIHPHGQPCAGSSAPSLP